MIKTATTQVVDLEDFDSLVEATYGRPYSFQQQDDCKERQLVHVTVPDGADDYENDTIPEEINGDEMGVSFAAWLARDPKQWDGETSGLPVGFYTRLFWERNFYPNVQMVLNDLHEKGLFPAGEYAINIDW